MEPNELHKLNSINAPYHNSLCTTESSYNYIVKKITYGNENFNHRSYFVWEILSELILHIEFVQNSV